MLHMRLVLLCVLSFLSAGVFDITQGAPRGASFLSGFRSTRAVTKTGAELGNKGWLQPAMRASAMQKYIVLLSTKNPRLAWVKFLGSQGFSGGSKLPEAKKWIDNALQYVLTRPISSKSLILLSE
jgi:hypothetical protein